ncbi:hypothetical protein Trydic_g10881 [Trypoxylus dichotomus]
MGGGRRRSRSESMIKLEQQKKQSKVWFEEANNQVKADNLERAVISYTKIEPSFSRLSYHFFTLATWNSPAAPQLLSGSEMRTIQVFPRFRKEMVVIWGYVWTVA